MWTNDKCAVVLLYSRGPMESVQWYYCISVDQWKVCSGITVSVWTNDKCTVVLLYQCGPMLGELVFIDLILQRDVAGTSVEETIKSLELAQNDQCSSSYLLVHTTSGKKWSLLLELRQSMFFADTDLSQSFELLAGTTVPLESFLQSDEVRTDFTPAAFKQFSNFVMLSVQRAKGKSFVAAHDAENNIYKVFDGSIDNWLPLYVYQVLPNSKHILLTDRLMFSIIRREPEGQVHLSVISNQMSETSSPTTEGDTDAIVQMFSLPANEVILEVYKESFPPQYLINLERRHREEQMDSMGEVKRTTAANQVSETECHTVLDGCLVITNAAIYQCRPR
uniref:Uncharacterized protein LOC102801041 n=1 Tax=Saccoglossus kowalevskii TaxID=10224 RepID=A0ABM0M3K0_SACKO|nr:PREDICTED: uncharacterized protein LOC102801041 [Saccoglossus kowalevskii]